MEKEKRKKKNGCIRQERKWINEGQPVSKLRDIPNQNMQDYAEEYVGSKGRSVADNRR